MNQPKSLYRFRAFDETNDEKVNRELNSLENAWVWASSPEKLNDPMESFFHFDKAEAVGLDYWFGANLAKVDKMKRLYKDFFLKSGSVSFTTSQDYLPFWAYYGGNFSGIRIEYDVALLLSGGLRSQKLTHVTYQKQSPEPFNILNAGSNQGFETTIQIMSTKHIDWESEKEWRIVTGVSGKMYFLPEAIKAVTVGPKINKSLKERIVNIGRKCRFEVQELGIRGFEVFETPLVDVGDFFPVVPVEGFDPDPHIWPDDLKEIQDFLRDSAPDLPSLLTSISSRSNFHSFNIVSLYKIGAPRLLVGTLWKVRNSPDHYENMYFDRDLNRIAE